MLKLDLRRGASCKRGPDDDDDDAEDGRGGYN